MPNDITTHLQGVDDELDALRERLSPFLSTNPHSTIGRRQGQDDGPPVIMNPWGDSSVIIPLNNQTDRIVAALNAVLLPARYTAIWHTRTKDMEVIFTAFPLAPSGQDLLQRKFEFQYDGASYLCEYATSSQELMTIAEITQPVSESGTEYRNLYSFYIYAISNKSLGEELAEKLPKVGEPVSFWIRGVEWNEANVLSLIRNLNFYMTYYDNRTPTILVHTPAPERASTSTTQRYRLGKFPSKIVARPTEENLLHFWSAARDGDPAQRFLFAFRIIEYVSFSFLEYELWLMVQRTLGSPHALDDLAKTTDELVSAMQATKLEPAQRFDQTVKAYVSPKTIWEEAVRSRNKFCCETEFDGGLVIQPLMTETVKQKDCELYLCDKAAKSVRDIRNALAHGKDLKTAQIILPTPANFVRLQPWANLVSTMAADVIINRSLPS